MLTNDVVCQICQIQPTKKNNKHFENKQQKNIASVKKIKTSTESVKRYSQLSCTRRIARDYLKIFKEIFCWVFLPRCLSVYFHYHFGIKEQHHEKQTSNWIGYQIKNTAYESNRRYVENSPKIKIGTIAKMIATL